jgi:DNA-binding transcriptional LysR family regulator
MPDLKTLDLNLLQALDALLDERSVTRAAVRLSVTQPAVSGLLTRLRRVFGDPLFTRVQRGLVPTERALQLAAPVKVVLAGIDSLFRPEPFDPSTARLTVTLGATDYALKAVVLPFAKALRARAPMVRLAVRPIDPAGLRDQLQHGEIDLALTTADSAPSDLHVRRLFDETVVCALRADHPETVRKTLSIARFCALEHVMVAASGDPFSGATDLALASLDRSRHVAVSLASFLLLPELLKASDLIAVAPRRVVEQVEGIVVRKLPLVVAGFGQVAVWHERTHYSEGLLWVRRLLFDTCGAG